MTRGDDDGAAASTGKAKHRERCEVQYNAH
jgi:hypothetical protein